MQELTERQRQIMTLSVALFIETAEPVSSRTLARRFQLPFSPATIRNERADLEELGYLVQPHTSSGRVPTDRGYQAYVASLRDLRSAGEEKQHLEALERQCLDSCKEAGELLQDAISILGTVTHLVAVAAFPGPERSTFTKLQLTSMDVRQVLVVLVTDASHAEAHLVPLTHAVPQDRLDVCSRLLNDRFSGRPLSEFLEGAVVVVTELETTYRETVQTVLTDFLDKVGKSVEREALVWGAPTVLSQPEFQDFQRARAVWEALERRDLLAKLLSVAGAGGAQITFVGSESDPGQEMLRDFSLVSAPYRTRGVLKGAIGILGPRRMDYPRAIRCVNHISDSLSRVFSDK